MNCNPSSLAKFAKCFCFSTGQRRAVMIYLLCRWVQGKTTTPVVPPEPVTCPASVATAATNIGATSFNANWNAASGATGYRLDVSTDPAFGSFVGIFHDLDVFLALTSLVTPLTDGVTYYYRVRAVCASGTSANSNMISAVPLTPFSYTPDTASMFWTDNNGLQSGNLAYFYANADFASIINIDIQSVGLTSITGLRYINSLTLAIGWRCVLSNNSITTIDISGCDKIYIFSAINNHLTSVIHSGTYPLLGQFELTGSSALGPTFDTSNFPAIFYLRLKSCGLTSQNIDSNTLLGFLHLDGNLLPMLGAGGVQDILQNLDASGVVVSFSQCNVSSQTPLATPLSAPAITAFNNLHPKGWEIYTDDPGHTD